MKGQDALHIAAALERGVQEFISTDDRLRRPRMIDVASALGVTGMRFVRASNTNVLPDEYLQSDMYE